MNVDPNEPTVVDPAFNDQKKHIEELNSLSVGRSILRRASKGGEGCHQCPH